MSRAAAVEAYRDSVYDAAVWRTNARIGAKSLPIIGGLGSMLGGLGNAIWRPFKVGGALVFGSAGGTKRDFPPIPEIPKEFQGTDLGKSLQESWKLKAEAANHKVDSFADLIDFNISGWWKKSSVAEHDEAKERSVLFPEEVPQYREGGLGGFAAGLISSNIGRNSGGQGR